MRFVYYFLHIPDVKVLLKDTIYKIYNLILKLVFIFCYYYFGFCVFLTGQSAHVLNFIFLFGTTLNFESRRVLDG